MGAAAAAVAEVQRPAVQGLLVISTPLDTLPRNQLGAARCVVLW
jgi:hypothetical protein